MLHGDYSFVGSIVAVANNNTADDTSATAAASIAATSIASTTASSAIIELPVSLTIIGNKTITTT
eukprot:CAMPEP_0178598994 /NCGR_PEP_ID=MMETSP0697-20121206/33065_1 /TAXON_ID=265572 /ORGANISM="Extubocellulus spinifer, Strain CCMP396" /LENGTH=64 /DNA_ID=CAMNT_0020236851 /DNA_START=106 /DNA_END=296 /DNA_ORIENTATION=-